MLQRYPACYFSLRCKSDIPKGHLRQLNIRFHEMTRIAFNLFPYAPECLLYLIRRTGYFRRVRKIFMEFDSHRRIPGASFPGMIANSNHEVEINVFILIHMIGCLRGNINTILSHRGNSVWMNAMSFHTGAVNKGPAAGEMPEISFRYLAAATVAGT